MVRMRSRVRIPIVAPLLMKKLYRSNDNKVLFGICGGIGEYLDIDPVVVRVITIILTILSAGALVIAYIICLFIIPSKAKD